MIFFHKHAGCFIPPRPKSNKHIGAAQAAGRSDTLLGLRARDSRFWVPGSVLRVRTSRVFTRCPLRSYTCRTKPNRVERNRTETNVIDRSRASTRGRPPHSQPADGVRPRSAAGRRLRRAGRSGPSGFDRIHSGSFRASTMVHSGSFGQGLGLREDFWGGSGVSAGFRGFQAGSERIGSVEAPHRLGGRRPFVFRPRVCEVVLLDLRSATKRHQPDASSRTPNPTPYILEPTRIPPEPSLGSLAIISRQLGRPQPRQHQLILTLFHYLLYYYYNQPITVVLSMIL